MVQREDGDQRAVMSGLFRKILKTVWDLINVVVHIALALSAWDMHRNRRAAHFIAWFVAGVFVLLAVPITFYEVAQHLENYRMPRLQRQPRLRRRRPRRPRRSRDTKRNAVKRSGARIAES